MVVFFGKGEYDSERLVLRCLKKLSAMSSKLGGCGVDFEKLTDDAVSNAEIAHGENGKPAFKNIDLKFSLSHSCGAYLVAFSNCEVGIDIEKIREIDAERFKRFADFSSADEFFAAWTELEAIAKYMGEGLSFLFRGKEKIRAKRDSLLREGKKIVRIPVFCGYAAAAVTCDRETVMLVCD